MMPDLNGMEFAVRKGGREESPSPSKAFIPLLLRLVRRSLPPCPCEISPTANRASRSFRQHKEEGKTKPEKKRLTR